LAKWSPRAELFLCCSSIIAQKWALAASIGPTSAKVLRKTMIPGPSVIASTHSAIISMRLSGEAAALRTGVAVVDQDVRDDVVCERIVRPIDRALDQGAERVEVAGLPRRGRRGRP